MPLYAYEEDIYDDLGQEYDDGMEYDELGEDEELAILLEEEEDAFGKRKVRRKGKRRKGKRRGTGLPSLAWIKKKQYQRLRKAFEKSTGLRSKMIPRGPGARKAQLKYYLAMLGWVKKNKKGVIIKVFKGDKVAFKIATNVLRNRVQKAKVRRAASK
tara:strand:- start:275 stop:745 length:471 start_codon:yes stop_codon:yes gene_type:complete